MGGSRISWRQRSHGSTTPTSTTSSSWKPRGLVGLVSTRRLVAAQSAVVQNQLTQLAAQGLELKRANEELSRSLEQQRLLEKQIVQKEKTVLVQTLVAGIAHELNNKLMPVLGYAELLV